MYQKDKNPIALYLSVLFAVGIISTMLSVGYNLDNTLAKWLYMPNSDFASFVSRKGSILPGAISLVFIIFLLVTPLRVRFPLVRRTAIVWLSALILGGGIFVHLVVKENIDRLRPRQELLAQQSAETAPVQPLDMAEARLTGKSFSSGHAAMAIMLAVPFFTLRRRFPKTAYVFLSAGILNLIIVGLGRMMLGAHFMTDIIWSMTFVLATAAITAHYVDEKTDFKTRYLLPLLLVGACIGILMNNFTRHYSLESASSQINFTPLCENIELNKAETNTFSFELDLTGAGAPISNIKLIEEPLGTVKLTTKGLFRNIKCDAKISVPNGATLQTTTDTTVTNSHLLPVRIRQSSATYYGK